MTSGICTDPEHRYLLPEEPIRSIDEYLATEWGGTAIARAVDIGPEATIAEISASGLRGTRKAPRWGAAPVQPRIRDGRVRLRPRRRPG